MTESKDTKLSKKNSNTISSEIIKKIIANANYCYDCNRCVNVCPTSFLGTFFPRKLITDLTFLPLEEALENNNIWNCLTCGLCMEYCPMSKGNIGVNFVELILNLRKLTPEYELLQAEQLNCHHERQYSNLPVLMANNEIEFNNRIGFLEGTNLKYVDKGEIAYFMGCVPFMNSVAPCSSGCPAGVDVQGYISLIREGKFQESIDLIRERNPFPIVCGRVCTHPCEESCNRSNFEDPVAIRALKRFISDWELKNKGKSKIKPVEQNREKVAIIGSGPAGLSAAFYLARKGYKPTVFEESPYLGGKLRSGIPEYRLPQDILDYEIEYIKNMGVEIKTNTPIGPNLTYDDLKKEGYKSLFISIGLGDSRSMRIGGDDLINVYYGLEFLEQQNLSYKDYDFKDKVVGIIGGGNLAIDSARTVQRLGAKKVVVIYRRSEKEMPALEEEIEAAKEENIEFQFLTNPIEIFSDEIGSCSEVECIRMELGKLDESGRRRPIKIEGSEFKLKLDVTIFAIGQVADYTLIKAAIEELAFDERGNFKKDSITFETNIPGVFAGGDVVGGKGIAIKAIHEGYEVAISIDRYLRGTDLKEGRVKPGLLKSSPIPKKEIKSVSRQEISMIPDVERVSSFKEVEKGISEDEAILEANRCLNCNICCNLDQKLDFYNKTRNKTSIQHSSYGENEGITYDNDFNYLNIPKSVIGLLNQHEILPVVLANEKCCGHDLLFNGDVNSFEKLAKYNIKLFKDAGVNTLILSCAEGYYMWKYEYPKLFKGTDEFDFEIYHLTEYILKEHLIDDIKFPISEKIRVTYHDACRLGRLSNVYDAPRKILNEIPFIELVEMRNNKQDAICCGVSAYINCDEYSKTIQRDRLNEAIDTGAEYLIVSCPKCLAHFNCYLNENLELKNKIKVLDLTSFIGKLLFLN